MNCNMHSNFTDEKCGEGEHHRADKMWLAYIYLCAFSPSITFSVTIKNIIFTAFFSSLLFFKSNVCASNSANSALILGCSLRPVFGFPPNYVIELGTIYSCGVNLIHSAFSWPVIRNNRYQRS